MKHADTYFQAVLSVFGKHGGAAITPEEEEAIAEAGLTDPDIAELCTYLVDKLESGVLETSQQRASAYWALSKLPDESLIPRFRNWLRQELSSGNTDTIFQILIALDNFEEPVFGADRNGSYAAMDTELNLRDAENYLDNLQST